MRKTTDKPREGVHDAGYSLIELLVAMLVSTLVVGGVLTMLTSVEEVHRDGQQLIDAQQSARISMEQMQRDLQRAGVGLAWLIPPLPLVVPQPGGGFMIRHNEADITATLTADMANPTDALTVNDVTGFEAGQSIGVYDAMGTIDLLTISSVDTVNNRILHPGATKAYTVVEGTAVARIATITYGVDAQGFLTRQVDALAPQPIAGNVVGLNVTYWSSGTPSVVFNPTTTALQMLIGTVQLDLTVETEDPRINTLNTRQVTLSTRVTPRAMVLS